MTVISKSQYKDAAKSEKKIKPETEEKSTGIASKSLKVREPQEPSVTEEKSVGIKSRLKKLSGESQDVSAIGAAPEDKKPKKRQTRGNPREEQERSAVTEEKSVDLKPRRQKSSNLITNEERSVSMSRHRPRSLALVSKKSDVSQTSRSKVERKLRSIHQAVKKFVSTPISEEKLRNLASKIQRKVRRTNPTEIIETSKRGEDVYVTRENRTVIRENLKEDSKPVEQTPPPMAKDKIYIHGRPFWFFPSSAPTDEDLKGVEDSFEFNSKTVLAVGDGKIKLKPMPTLRIVMDPFTELEVIKEKDAVYFNREIVFSNTFRSMIYPWNNVSSSGDDPPTTPSTISSSKSKSFDNLAVVIIERSVKIDEPTTVTFYKRKHRDLRRVEKFEHRKTVRM